MDAPPLRMMKMKRWLRIVKALEAVLDFDKKEDEIRPEEPKPECAVKENIIPLGLIKWTKTQVRCLFCCVCIPKADRCIDQHITGSQHLASIECMKRNAVGFKDGMLFCKPCDTTLEGISVYDHINSEDHKDWKSSMSRIVMGEFTDFNRYLALETEKIFCILCKEYIFCDKDTVQTHVDSMKHSVSIYESQRPQHGMFYIPNRKTLCKICNLVFDTDIKILRQHIEDDNGHIAWLMDVEDQIQDEHVIISGYLSILEETHAYCSKCNIKVDCNAKAIESHVNSPCHLLRYILNSNTSTTQTD